ncbi:hypothetical protein [Thermus albus]|uniref:hypothetical protein n=1 Tax=Thermus albus TaxID=2908146 RepID=UPI001FA9B8B1|nr:hypothetical protein [Thermus albus]
MRTYNPTLLRPHDPTSATWALMWARNLARDVPVGDAWRPGGLEDEEWLGWLEATAIRLGGSTYYRPHEAAARAIRSDPTRLRALALAGVSQDYPDPNAVAAAIRAEGRWIDDLIADLTGVRPAELAPRF